MWYSKAGTVLKTFLTLSDNSIDVILELILS
jgi:hypothetical protein